MTQVQFAMNEEKKSKEIKSDQKNQNGQSRVAILTIQRMIKIEGVCWNDHF